LAPDAVKIVLGWEQLILLLPLMLTVGALVLLVTVLEELEVQPLPLSVMVRIYELAEITFIDDPVSVVDHK
jgi:hypothetical protein